MNEEYEAKIRELENKVMLLEEQDKRIDKIETRIQDILLMIDET